MKVLPRQHQEWKVISIQKQKIDKSAAAGLKVIAPCIHLGLGEFDVGL
jgi:hypothetical protein